MSDYLPWDITIEILSRLPVKSLMRFKCVSKSFDYLISQDGGFKKKHLHQSNLARAIIYSVNETNCVISCHPSYLASDEPIDKDMIKLDLPVQVQGQNYSKRNIYNYCDGLFCMRDIIGGGVSIWNPHTRELKRIPDCPPDDITEKLVEFRRVAYGLAYDSVSDDYKVLGIVEFNVFGGGCVHQFKIYSLKMDSSWRKISDVFPCKQLLWHHNITVVNGAFHWVAQDNKDSPIELVSLDIGNEKFRKFALPEPLCYPPMLSYNRIPVVCTLREKLCLLSRYRYIITLWMMEEYGVVQSLKKILCLSPKVLRSFVSRPLYLFEDCTIMIYELGCQEQVNLYKDGSFVRKSAIAYYDTMCAYIGRETLISPHMCNQRYVGTIQSKSIRLLSKCVEVIVFHELLICSAQVASYFSA